MKKRKSQPARCLAVFGTGSDVGKSIVCTALCRMVSNLGCSVAPFKAQNMSNNSWVTAEGGEMGRAQVVQAEAARCIPHVDMNPVLLKPSSDVGSQVILHGRVRGNTGAQTYWKNTDELFQEALKSLDRLRASYDVVIMEGAGSCAEVNLRDRDFVNFRMAHAAEADVLLVADIDRGGVFAQVVGTLDIIPPDDRALVKGIVINRFRGDPELFYDGIDYLEHKTGLPVLGLVPYFYHIDIESEDGVILDEMKLTRTFDHGEVSIGVVKLPHISNFTDFDVFRRDTAVRFTYLYHPRPLDAFDLIILPGTKNVRFDLDWLRARGWGMKLKRYVETGGSLAGICGGYQMLGTVIHDPDGLEGTPGTTPGLEFLDMETTLTPEKMLTRVSGTWVKNGEPVTGYEIHMGRTAAHQSLAPAVHIHSRNSEPADVMDGASSPDGKVWGSYIHGLFDEPGFRRSFLEKLFPERIVKPPAGRDESQGDFKNRQYDLLAEHFTAHLDGAIIWRLLGLDVREREHEKLS